MTAFRRSLVTALASRATVSLVLAGGLLWVAGSDAAVVATIAATVILASIIINGVAMTWLGSRARQEGVEGSGWMTAAGAVVLLAGMAAPVWLIPDPLIDSAVVLWIYAGAFSVAGILEVCARATRAAGYVSLTVSAALALAIVLRPGEGLPGLLGWTGVIFVVAGVALAFTAVRTGMRPAGSR